MRNRKMRKNEKKINGGEKVERVNGNMVKWYFAIIPIPLGFNLFS